MCGIFGFHAKHSVLTDEEIDILFSYAEKRGREGVGIAIIKPEKNIIHTSKFPEPYSSCKSSVIDFVFNNLGRGDILIGYTRNAPETEALTTSVFDESLDKYLQPIVIKDLVYVHNGAISDKYVDQYKDQKTTYIDSEVIGLAYYNHGCNLVKTMESISGGWSVIGYDRDKKRLQIVSSFIPLAQGFARGLGYIIHSDLDAVRALIAKYKGMNDVKYMRTWEDFYADELQPFTIYEIDLDSHLVNERKYKHHFIHPVWKEENNKGTKYLVLASSGIDSTATLAYLKDRVNVTALHFDYGQKSREAEKVAIEKICKELNIELVTFDLSGLYEKIGSSSSMLLNEDITVTTGGKDIKTTAAWVPARNMIFMTIAAAYAEELILNNKYSKVYICGGWDNISEESVYPDNSKRMIDAFQNFVKFGTLSGTQDRIQWINIFSGLTKKEELLILKYLGYEKLFGYTVSCDHAIVKDGEVYQCSKDGKPACGSGKLSKWAAELAGIEDTRKYYEVDWDVELEDALWEKLKQKDKSIISVDIADIISRLVNVG